MKKSISVNRKSRGRPKKKGGVHPVTAVRLSPEVGTAAHHYGIALHELTPQHASLEEAFFELTGDAVEYHAAIPDATDGKVTA